MSEVLIIARTRMRHGKICVGAVDRETSHFLRLLNGAGYSFLDAAPFQVGEIWDVRYVNRPPVTPPHVEDVRVLEMRRVTSHNDPGRWLRENARRIRLWRGSPRTMYDGTLTFPQRAHAMSNPHAAYVERGRRLPSCSLGLWETDRLLVRRQERYDGVARVRYDGVETHADDVSISLSHKGFGREPIIIPPGSIVSLSLARWWAPDDGRRQPERCYVQLCDVVALGAPTHVIQVDAELDLSDVPF
ncbi:MAG TPA: hypothetical protein VM450_14850 [Thermomicrobiales bacterium]|nr:hypothetical protein [Thermomicrobiales bacterium]